MYDSIKDWIDVPIKLMPFSKYDGMGDKEFGQTLNILCYPVGDIKVVSNELGVDVTSNTQLYIDGSQNISELDNVIFEGKERPIKAITTYYRNGIPDIKVVYL